MERIFSWNDILSQVTLIHLNKIRGLLLVHEENRISNGIWERTTREVDDVRFTSKIWPTFRDLPDKWTEFF